MIFFELTDLWPQHRPFVPDRARKLPEFHVDRAPADSISEPSLYVSADLVLGQFRKHHVAQSFFDMGQTLGCELDRVLSVIIGIMLQVPFNEFADCAYPAPRLL